jgi:hypothetical protein
MSALAAPYAGIPRINLMPRSEVARRERDKLVRLWVWIVLGSIVVALLIIAGAFTVKFFADQRLAAEQARTNALLTEVAALSDVSQALAAQTELTDFRAEALANDLAWTPVIAKVTGILPPDTVLTGFDVAVGGVPQGDDPALEPGVAGTITIDSATPLDIVAIIRALRQVDGVLAADGRSVTSSQVAEGRFAYQLDVAFDQSVYSHAFAPAEGSE